MIVVMQSGSSQEQIDAVCNRIKEVNLGPELIAGVDRSIIGIVGTIFPTSRACWRRCQESMK